MNFSKYPQKHSEILVNRCDDKVTKHGLNHCLKDKYQINLDFKIQNLLKKALKDQNLGKL